MASAGTSAGMLHPMEVWIDEEGFRRATGVARFGRRGVDVPDPLEQPNHLADFLAGALLSVLRDRAMQLVLREALSTTSPDPSEAAGGQDCRRDLDPWD